MRALYIDEPELEFGGGKHVDIRFGLMHLGPLDVGGPRAPRQIELGLVGTTTTLEGTRKWLERCREEVAAKESRLSNLFPRFPGFRHGVAFDSEVVVSPELHRTIPKKALAPILEMDDLDAAAKAAAEIFLHEIGILLESRSCQAIGICVPTELVQLRDRQALRYLESGGQARPLDFHDYLKATSRNAAQVPLQLVLPSTYGGRMPAPPTGLGRAGRTIQDEATRAWNLHTALYYKAGGSPWRVPPGRDRYATCYVGISFPVTDDREYRFTSLAQVFDERGDGVIVRGGKVATTKKDRVPHLPEADAESLLRAALDRYYDAHKQYPARVVVHKSSEHSKDELAGFRRALSTHHVQLADFISFGARLDVRLFRSGKYPPLRGTLLELDERDLVLYTRGSVDFYRTYPGMYVPKPLAFRIDEAESTAEEIAREILALTKMNWNDTQFDHREPITLAASRRVGRILKHADRDNIATRYAFYM